MDRGQLIFLSLAALFILYQVIRGWRLGLVRQIVRFGAVVAAYLVGIWGGRWLVPFLRPIGYPDFVLQFLGGVCLGIIVYLAVCVLGGILFKRTVHQSLGLVWFVYGFTGALIGLGFGLAMTLLAADAIRLLGGLVEGALAAPQSVHAKADNPVYLTLAGMKQSLERGVTGEVLQTLDPAPRKLYVTTSKMGRVIADPEAIDRFFSDPGAKELATRPEVKALREDPEIFHSLRDHQYLPLLKNAKVIKVANDPNVAALLKKFELEKALDRALAKEDRPHQEGRKK